MAKFSKWLQLAGACAAAILPAAGAHCASLRGEIPAIAARLHPAGVVPANEPVALALALPLRNTDDLQILLSRLYDRRDPLYGKYLTPAQFSARYSPTPSDYAALAQWANTQGLTVTGRHANRLLLDVTGPAAAVDRAFSTSLVRYSEGAGTLLRRAPSAEPIVPAAVSRTLTGVVGLSSAIRRPMFHLVAPMAPPPGTGGGIGTGPGDGLSPSDIRTAYNLSAVNLTGAGQTLAVFEYSGYNASDISGYESQFSLPSVPLQNVIVDGGPSAGSAPADEATLDIELQIALAPGASAVRVYECPNTDTGTLDALNRMAQDDTAKQISICWGIYEFASSASFLRSENAIFQQMAAQGQTVYAAAGDSGAYDDGSNLSVDDPASQPYVCGVGASSLETTARGGAWRSETTWDTGSISGGAGGGGISAVWAIPSWQQNMASSEAKASTTMRNVPDVSLNGDPDNGYAIYFNGHWGLYGGASCAAPLWTAFNALVNQQRAAQGEGPVGQVAPGLYQIASGSAYSACFHDIADGSTNLYYPAVSGYDLATGLGSFRGSSLLTALAPPASGAAASVGTFAAGLQFLSLPYDYADVSPDQVLGYAGVQLATWDSLNIQYALSPAPLASRLRIGRGYWVRLPRAVTVTLAGTPADAGSSYSLPLSPGWNSIGDPFAASVPLASMDVIGGGQTVTLPVAMTGTPIVNQFLYRYDSTLNNNQGGYAQLTSSDSLAPGQGVWVYAYQSATLSIPPP